jgi:hypothetical protein
MGYASGTRWTDELIRQKVLEVKDALELGRMPSRQECRNYYHGDSLVNAISRRKRWYALADELGLPVKESETKFGKTWESNAIEQLSSRGFSCRKMDQNFPYDILVNDCVKVDVKASHKYHGPNGDFFTFNLEKQFATCDIYILFSLNDDNSIDRVFIVPSKFVIAQNQISVGISKSRYNRFVDKWDYIDALSSFWDEVS